MRHFLLNAASAAAYIVVVASVLFYVPERMGQKDTVLIPIAILSLFVLSAAVMGFLFLYRPAMLYLDGEKKEAVTFFLKTLAAFAVITGLFFAALVLGVS